MLVYGQCQGWDRSAGLAPTAGHIDSGDEQATKLGVDEIIIGSRGLRPFGAALLGSVPYKVVHDTKVPVVVVR